jgi:hypothetical protein
LKKQDSDFIASTIQKKRSTPMNNNWFVNLIK